MTKYLDLNGLSHLKAKLDLKYANLNHTHTKSQITDYKEYSLPIASADTLGGIKVGAGLAINEGVLSATGGGTADSIDWSNVQNKPTKLSEFTNDLGYQTSEEVNNIIKNIIGTAPENLNTLEELSNALGNDENFASTITTELSKKVNSSDLIAITNDEIDSLWG